MSRGRKKFVASLFQIKRLDPGSNEVTTIAGTGKAGFLDGSPFKAQVKPAWFLGLAKFACDLLIFLAFR